jgi:hypothetical protein
MTLKLLKCQKTKKVLPFHGTTLIFERASLLFEGPQNSPSYLSDKSSTMVLTWGNRSLRRDTCPSATLSTTNSTYIGL